MIPPAPGVELPSGLNPWSASAQKKRLAKEFVNVRSQQVQEVIPQGLPLPEHVKPFAEYMARRADKRVTNRDIVKAYLLTVGSMQRSAISPQKVEEYWPAFEPRRSGKIRPEDVLGKLLESPAGQRYLNAAEQGRYDAQAATAIAGAFDSFGLGNRFRKQLADAPEIAAHGNEIRKRLRGSRAGWYQFIGNGGMPGINLSKSGFVAALLGRGDIATADAREINFWTCPPTGWDSSKKQCKFPAVGYMAKGKWHPGQFESLKDLVTPTYLELLNRSMRSLKVQMPERYQPFYEHLAHHTFWDRVGGTKTTHQEIIDAMELAGY